MHKASDSQTFVRDYDYDSTASGDGSTLPGLADVSPIEKIPPPSPKKRAGYTTNKGKPRNKARARMAKVSRVRNRR